MTNKERKKLLKLFRETVQAALHAEAEKQRHYDELSELPSDEDNLNHGEQEEHSEEDSLKEKGVDLRVLKLVKETTKKFLTDEKSRGKKVGKDTEELEDGDKTEEKSAQASRRFKRQSDSATACLCLCR